MLPIPMEALVVLREVFQKERENMALLKMKEFMLKMNLNST